MISRDKRYSKRSFLKSRVFSGQTAVDETSLQVADGRVELCRFPDAVLSGLCRFVARFHSAQSVHLLIHLRSSTAVNTLDSIKTVRTRQAQDCRRIFSACTSHNREHSAVMATELLQPPDLACGTLFQSSCVIATSPTDCSDDS